MGRELILLAERDYPLKMISKKLLPTPIFSLGLFVQFEPDFASCLLVVLKAE